MPEESAGVEDASGVSSSQQNGSSVLPVLPESQTTVTPPPPSNGPDAVMVVSSNNDTSGVDALGLSSGEPFGAHEPMVSDNSTHTFDIDAIDASDPTGKSLHSRASSNCLSTKDILEMPAEDPGFDDEDDDEENLLQGQSPERIILGICAMDKKARSKPMAEILSRLDEKLFDIIIFGDDVILNQSIEQWPECDVLIAFFSKGYPIKKARAYVELRKPLILNDLEMQELMQDRRRVYDLLEASGIDVPRHVYLSRDGYVSTGTGDGNGARDQEVMEYDDHIEINGVTIHKPFVEKPVNAEDHNISIYYPTSAGGGCKKLFRKIGNRSSCFYPSINEVRREGSFIYEEFVETQGTDVKMYTVGPEYGHAEARKSPTVDGKVERNSDGKEVRFPVILTFREKEIARRIVLVFKQFVCGFDILRVQEGHAVVSYVCDVNGWSFVKKSRKYYDDCAQILSEHILALIKPDALKTFSTLDPLVTTSGSVGRLDEGAIEEAQPKRKENLLTRAARMLQGEPAGEDSEGGRKERYGNKDTERSHSPTRSETSLLNEATTLVEGALPVREFPSNLTSAPPSMTQSANSSIVEEKGSGIPRTRSNSLLAPHQEELRCVVAIIRHGDRTPKQKLKVIMKEPHILKYFHDHVEDCRKDLKVKAKAPMTEFLETVKTTLDELDKEHQELRYQLMHMRDILERWKIVGLNRKLQIKPKKFEEYTDENGETKQRAKSVELVLKWGGNLTKLGEKQSVHLGKTLRHEMYPDAPGGGILRLHSTFRHDLKIKTSDEGRVMKTAAAFAKGLLELEGDLPPILVSLVHKEKGSMHMLDPSGNKEAKKELDVLKKRMTENLQKDIDFAGVAEEIRDQIAGPEEFTSLRDALYKVGNPRKTLFKIHESMGELISQLEEMLDEMGSGDENRMEGGEGLVGKADDDVALSGVKLYKGETLLELTERWRFIYDRLYDSETDRFDLSRVPDVHDNARFDVLHNPHLGLTNILHRLYDLGKIMADCVVPQEYGTTIEEKRSIGVKICHGLLEKIKFDLNVARTDNDVDMRYLINMAYGADMNVNSMGRRIRTRLYFTSESHLHTVLSVLRFANNDDKLSLLSEHGVSIINSTPELCYLTQIVLRVFEDARRDIDDPRRFRVEILFSPGATATPFHMHELARDADASRLDTAPLQLISRDGLSCQDVEDFFEKAIMEGKSDEDDDVASTPIIKANKSQPKKVVEQDKKVPSSRGAPKDTTVVEKVMNGVASDVVSTKVEAKQAVAEDSSGGAHKSAIDLKERSIRADDGSADDEGKPDNVIVRRKYFWGTVAVGSFVLGASFLVMALSLSEGSQRRRRWSRRY